MVGKRLNKEQQTLTYIRSDLSEDKVNRAADNVVAPGSIISAVRLFGQCTNTFVHTLPLRVRSLASQLGGDADLLDSLPLVLDI
jgi:hypothetical protein